LRTYDRFEIHPDWAGTSAQLRLFEFGQGAMSNTVLGEAARRSLPQTKDRAHTNLNHPRRLDFFIRRWRLILSHPAVGPVRDFLCQTYATLFRGNDRGSEAPLWHLLEGVKVDPWRSGDPRKLTEEKNIEPGSLDVFCELMITHASSASRLVEYLRDEAWRFDVSEVDFPVKDAIRRLGGEAQPTILYGWIVLEGERQPR
jgi:hypothetical protein